MAAIERGPDPDADGCCAWTRADLCRWLEAEYGKRPTTRRAWSAYTPTGLRRLGFSRQKARPFHPKKDAEGVTLVPPAVNTAAMQVFLDHVAASRPADAHLVMVLDRAGGHC